MHFKSMAKIAVVIGKYVRPLKTKEPDQIALIRLRMERAEGTESSGSVALTGLWKRSSHESHETG